MYHIPVKYSDSGLRPVKNLASNSWIAKIIELEKYTLFEKKNAGFNLMAIRKAGIKARLMTGTYVFQSSRAKFNQYKVNQTWLLCEPESEGYLGLPNSNVYQNLLESNI